MVQALEAEKLLMAAGYHVGDLGNKVRDGESNRAAAEAALKAKERAYNEVSETVANHKRQHQHAEQGQKRFRQKLQEAEDQNAELRSQLDAAMEKSNVAAQEDIRAAHDKTTKHLAEAQSRLTRAEEASGALKTKLDQLHAKCVEATTRLGETVKEKETLVTQVEQLSLTDQSLQQELDEARRRCEDVTQQLAEAEKVARLDTQQAEQEKGQLETDLAGVRGRCDDVTQQLAQTVEEKTSLIAQVAELQRQIEQTARQQLQNKAKVEAAMAALYSQ